MCSFSWKPKKLSKPISLAVLLCQSKLVFLNYLFLFLIHSILSLSFHYTQNFWDAGTRACFFRLKLTALLNTGLASLIRVSVHLLASENGNKHISSGKTRISVLSFHFRPEYTGPPDVNHRTREWLVVRILGSIRFVPAKTPPTPLWDFAMDMDTWPDIPPWGLTTWITYFFF